MSGGGQDPGEYAFPLTRIVIGFCLRLGYNAFESSVRPLTDGEERLNMEGLLQPTHLFFILLIVLIIFGPGKLPELGKGLGKGIKEFKDAMRSSIDGASEKK